MPFGHSRFLPHVGDAATHSLRVSKATILTTLLVLAFAPFGGCARPEQETVSPPLETMAVMPADLGIPDADISMPGEHPIDTLRTTGRFPAGLSIAKVVATPDKNGNGRRLRPGDMPIERAAYWNQVLDTLPPIREVTQLRDLGIDPRGVSYVDFLRESSNINCSLCLLYGRRDDDNGDSWFVGALWDAKKNQAISAYSVPIVIDAEEMDDADDEDERRIVWLKAEAQAELELRTLVRDSLWELVKLDTAGTTTQPSPWRQEDSVLPRDQNPFRKLEDLLKKK